MKAPYVGRAGSLVVLLGFAVWWAARISAGRPAEPNGPFPAPAVDARLSPEKGRETAVFAGGCFWGVEGVFQRVKGVKRAVSGYAGGNVENPYYDLVSGGSTGHAESVLVEYDPSEITYGQLLMVFFSVAHDPTQANRQGPDIGTQYRSALFFRSSEQEKIARAYVHQINQAKVYPRVLATEIVPYSAFYPAEDYHQDYLRRNPDSAYIRANDLPKLERLRKTYPELYR
jgi:peptide-methionine (S)-S-oxide reductase